MKSVVTYINSGNVVFVDKHRQKEELENDIRQVINSEYDLDTPVLIRSLKDFEGLMQILPDD